MIPHRALHIHDILCEIFQHLSPLSGQSQIEVKQKQSSLAKSARVCKTFVNPALDVLWQDLHHDIIPLMRLFTTFNKPLAPLGAFGPISPEEWMRFHTYARRVRRVALDDLSLPLASLIADLGRRNGGNPLLPSLSELQWLQVDLADRSFLPLVSPSLHTLEIRQLGCRIGSPDQLLNDLVKRAPHLRTLYLKFDNAFSLLPIAMCTHLRKLQIEARQDSPGFEYSGLKAISKMDQLEEFRIVGTLHGQPRACGGFLTLKLLSITGPIGGSDKPISLFLRCISAPCLQTLGILDFERNDEAHEILDYMTAAAECYGASLRRIHCCVANTTSSRDARSFFLVRPLLGIRHLQHIRLEFVRRPLLLTDANALEMASAWPYLKALRIDYKPNRAIDCLSVLALAHFARLCPNLETLRFTCITARNFDTLQTNAHPLRKLSLGFPFSSMEDRVAAANALHSLFPNLDWGSYVPATSARGIYVTSLG